MILWERLSEIQVSEIHYCTCFLLWIIPHLLHKAFYFKKTPLTLTRELTEEEIEPRSKEDCHPRGQSAHKDSGSKCITFFSSTSDVVRKTSKPRATQKQDFKNTDTFASNWGKGNSGKELLRDSGIAASSIEYSQHHRISQISSEDTF